MRTQYHLWPAAEGRFDAWDVDRLIVLSCDLPVERVPIDAIAELDTPYWSDGTGTTRTIRQIVSHTRLILAADLSYPIILGDDGRVMDGMHRVARALLAGRPEVAAGRFPGPVEPDYRDCVPHELPYPRQD